MPSKLAHLSHSSRLSAPAAYGTGCEEKKKEKNDEKNIVNIQFAISSFPEGPPSPPFFPGPHTLSLPLSTQHSARHAKQTPPARQYVLYSTVPNSCLVLPLPDQLRPPLLPGSLLSVLLPRHRSHPHQPLPFPCLFFLFRFVSLSLSSFPFLPAWKRGQTRQPGKAAAIDHWVSPSSISRSILSVLFFFFFFFSLLNERWVASTE
ncbi:hypothetical protein L209DRAFT_613794 [Thermothelomyces heterothallicus CBS 203.75]